MSTQQLPIKITGRFAHFYPESIIEIPDDFWAKLRQELYPPHLFRPENAIDIQYQALVGVDAGTGTQTVYDLSANDKEHILYYFFFGEIFSDRVNSWLLKVNNQTVELRDGYTWSKVNYGIANEVHIHIHPKENFQVVYSRTSVATPYSIDFLLRGYKWIEN